MASTDFSAISLIIALGAGLLSFISPCVLPLVPAYLGYITGSSIASTHERGSRGRLATLVPTLAFVGGLAAVFTLLGATATAAGRMLAEYQPLLTRAGGLVVMVFGLHLAGVVRVPWLYQTRQTEMTRFESRGVVGSAMMGAAFAFGWVPCVGPLLAGILGLASQESTVVQGMLLLFAYALGLGIPFILVGLMLGPALRGIQWLKPRLGTIEIASGLLLVALGFLLFTDQYGFIAGRLTEMFGIGLAI